MDAAPSAKLKPDWAGQDWLSRSVNLLIQTKPIYGLMKQQARKVLIKTAEKNGIPWRQTVVELDQGAVTDRLPALTNPGVTYPDYYRVPFHAYDAGNLCWQAAFEAEPATYSMALRVWPEEGLTWQAARDRLRGSFHRVLADYGPERVTDILDIGCSVGLSTLPLHRFYADRQGFAPTTIGLDLSPYMLAVAQHRAAAEPDAQGIRWVHGLAESTGFDAAAFDLITLQFVIHELPQAATRAIAEEALRLLRPGGALAIVDNNPKSPVIQSLPPVLFTLMKSTEPWTDEYYPLDVEGLLQDLGFEVKPTIASDPRHRAIVARKPGA
jgi:ubiquinone/menaquinone biosynthesis C-methylase UbiE